MGASVIAHGDTTPVFDTPKHVFYLVPLFIKLFVIGDWFFPVFLGRYARGNTFFKQSIAKPCSVISPVGQKFFGVGQGGKQMGCALVITYLTFGKE